MIASPFVILQRARCCHNQAVCMLSPYSCPRYPMISTILLERESCFSASNYRGCIISRASKLFCPLCGVLNKPQ